MNSTDRQHVLSAVHNADLRARIEALGYTTEPAKKRGLTARSRLPACRARRSRRSRPARPRSAPRSTWRGAVRPRERELAALSTRGAKTPELATAVREEGWAALGRSVGFDARTHVEQARDAEYAR